MDKQQFEKLKKGDLLRFKEKTFYVPYPPFFGNSLPLCTKEQFENLGVSYAHIYAASNNISRYGNKIGTLEDIELINKGE